MTFKSFFIRFLTIFLQIDIASFWIGYIVALNIKYRITYNRSNIILDFSTSLTTSGGGGGVVPRNMKWRKYQIRPELEINEAVVAPIVSNSTTSLLFINFYLRSIKILMQIFKDFKKIEFVLFDLKALRNPICCGLSTKKTLCTLYRVISKRWDFRDDYTEFLLSCILIYFVPCNIKLVSIFVKLSIFFPREDK